MLPMDVMYDVRSATVPIEMMILKAIEEPILMQCRRQEIPVEMMMELTGTS